LSLQFAALSAKLFSYVRRGSALLGLGRPMVAKCHSEHEGAAILASFESSSCVRGNWLQYGLQQHVQIFTQVFDIDVELNPNVWARFFFEIYRTGDRDEYISKVFR
jgi:hypothetical protein